MSSLLALTRSQKRRTLDQGEALLTEGDEGGELYVLESGRLSVAREGVVIATIDEPGALIGEMAVLLGTDNSATVRAETAVSVRVIEEPITFLERTPLVALQVATLVCARLDATSALLVELKKEARGRPGEEGLLARIFAAISGAPARPGGRAAGHE